ncbi:hypothetical protein V3C99_013859 [Haemonchus contortus]
MSGVFRRRDPNASSQVDSRLILDDGPIGASDYQIREHVWREPAGMDSNFDGYRRGSSYSMCPVHGSTHSIWRPVRQESRESRAIFEGGYRLDCPVHGLPPPTATSECVIHSESFHTAILNTEHDVIVVPPEPLGEPVEPPQSPYEEPGVFQQRVLEPELLSENSRRSSRRSSAPRRSRSRRSQRSRSRSRSRRRSSRGSQYTARTYSRRSSSCSTQLWTPRVAYSAKSLYAALKDFYEKYPRLATALAVIIFLYFFIHQLDVTIAHIFECFIRIIYPAGHYIAVTNEQFFARLSRMASRSDEIIEAFYCDVANTWCQRFELMCEVRCSFVEHTLQRIRKHPH